MRKHGVAMGFVELAENPGKVSCRIVDLHILPVGHRGDGGTGEQEVARNKEELRALMECEFKEMPQPLDYELFNYTENPLGEYGWSIFTNVLAKIDSEGVTMEMLTRLTCICVKEDGKWKIASLHMSTPTVEQEHQEFSLSVMAGITVSGSFLLKPAKS